jgi:predicted RND superfamily exporter protein
VGVCVRAIDITVSIGLVLGVIVAVAVVLVLLIAGFLIYKRRVDTRQKELMAEYTSQIQQVRSRGRAITHQNARAHAWVG